MKCGVCKTEIPQGALWWEWNGRTYCGPCREKACRERRAVEERDVIGCMWQVIEDRKTAIQTRFGGSMIPDVEAIEIARKQVAELIGELLDKKYPEDPQDKE